MGLKRREDYRVVCIKKASGEKRFYIQEKVFKYWLFGPLVWEYVTVMGAYGCGSDTCDYDSLEKAVAVIDYWTQDGKEKVVETEYIHLDQRWD